MKRCLFASLKYDPRPIATPNHGRAGVVIGDRPGPDRSHP